MTDELQVDIGAITMTHALATQKALRLALDTGAIWSEGTYNAVVEVRAILALRIAQAEHGVKVDA